MSLKVTLEIEPKEFLLQQDAVCKFKAQNVAKESVMVVAPSPGSTMPIWRVVSLKDGAERVFQAKPSLFSEPRLMDLAPGAEVSMGANLSMYITFPEPGEYDVTIEYEWNRGAGKAKSEPVRLKVLPSRPRWCDMASPSGGMSGKANVLWVHQLDGGAELIISPVDLSAKRPRVLGIYSLGKIRDTMRPILSVPNNGELPDRLWVAWLEGRRLEGFPVGPDFARHSRIVIKSIELPDVPTTLAAPLLPYAERSEEAAAAVLIQTGKGGKSNIQIAVIEPDGSLSEGPAGPIHDGAPVWVKGVAFRAGDRRIFVAAQAGEEGKKETTLQNFDWRLKTNELPLTGGAKIQGAHVGSGLALNMDDLVMGATIVATSPAIRSWELWAYRWNHGLHGDHEPADAIRIDWDMAREPKEARVALDDQGSVFAIIRGGDNKWYRWQSDDLETIPVAEPAGKAETWLDLAMLGMRQPLIILAQPPNGLQFFGIHGMGIDLPAHP